MSQGMLSLASRPAKTITVAALAGAAFAVAYKATSRYLGGADEEDGNLDDEMQAAIDMGPVPEGGFDYICPYQVKLASGKLVMAPYDIDKFIRLRPDPLAPAAHGLLQAVKDAGVSDDQLLDTALKAVDKLADAFEVRDGSIDDCF